MKKLITILLTLVLITGILNVSVAETKSSEIGNKLGIQILSQLYDKNSTTFVSPMSLAYAFAMAEAGADAETKDEILNALTTDTTEPLSQWIKNFEKNGINIANAIFVQKDIPVEDEYLDTISEKFKAEYFDQLNPTDINNWVRNKTNNMIDKLLDPDAEVEASTILLNAATMDLKWLNQFGTSDTNLETFNGKNEKTNVDMMTRRLNNATYGNRSDAEFIKLPYETPESTPENKEKSDIYAIAILPKTDNLQDILNNITIEGMDYFKQTWTDDNIINLHMPRFEIDMTNQLKKPLEELNIKTIFDINNADFSKMSTVPQYIDDITQSIHVEVGETGTKAGTITAFEFMTKSAMPDPIEPIEMKFNKPFIFIIADEKTDTIIFAGIISDIPNSTTDYSARNN